MEEARQIGRSDSEEERSRDIEEKRDKEGGRRGES